MEKTEAANALVLSENLLVLNIVDEKTLLLAKVSGAVESGVQLHIHFLAPLSKTKLCLEEYGFA